MARKNRTKEILSSMHSFSEGKYPKKKLLPEYFELQKEMINLTFNDDHAENGKLRIWDVENHLEKLNEECGHVANEELKAFKEDSKIFCNLIKSELSGNAGEYKAFRSLETLRCKNKIMKNIEFKSGDHRTEIDAIVFTEKAVFIIEVKNSLRDIYIDERGNYFRISDIMHLDCNIGEKMNDKIYLLREALKPAGYSNANIVNLLVFTNSTMQVDNKYEYITTCFLGNLPHIIEEYDGKPIYSDSSISAMMESVTNAECKEAYPIEMDMDLYKYHFANLMATLEEAAQNRSDTTDVSETESKAEKTDLTATDNAVSDEPKEFAPKPHNEARFNTRAVIGMTIAFGIGAIVSQVFNSVRK